MMGLDTEWRKPHEAKWWFNAVGEKLADAPEVALRSLDQGRRGATCKYGWRKLEGEDLEEAKQADPDYMADKLAANKGRFPVRL